MVNSIRSRTGRVPSRLHLSETLNVRILGEKVHRFLSSPSNMYEHLDTRVNLSNN